MAKQPFTIVVLETDFTDLRTLLTLLDKMRESGVRFELVITTNFDHAHKTLFASSHAVLVTEDNIGDFEERTGRILISDWCGPSVLFTSQLTAEEIAVFNQKAYKWQSALAKKQRVLLSGKIMKMLKAFEKGNGK